MTDVRSILDPLFPDTPSNENDRLKTFARIWRELDELEGTQAVPASRIRLECNDEVVEMGSVEVTGFRDAASNGVLIQFVCPRCGRRHESPRLG